MNPNNMTGEPNQQSHSSVFGFDLYPPSYPINWNSSNPFVNTHYQSTPVCGPRPQANTEGVRTSTFSNVQASQMNLVSNHLQFGQSQAFAMASNAQPQNNFSFGSSKPMQDIVQFPFQITDVGFGQREIRCKRKTDSPPLQPAKQHITEEKMAEHMSNLHISSESASSKESESRRLQRLYLCEEMRKFKTDPILPQCLLNRIQKPCTALVLWRPPAKLLPSIGDNNENENNNAESAPDNNVMAEETVDIDIDNEISVNNMDMDNC